jgi:hypothetical protein
MAKKTKLGKTLKEVFEETDMVTFDIETKPITAKTRKLKGKWTIQTKNDLASLMGDTVAEEIDKAIVSELRRKAEGKVRVIMGVDDDAWYVIFRYKDREYRMEHDEKFAFPGIPVEKYDILMTPDEARDKWNDLIENHFKVVDSRNIKRGDI